VPYREAELAMVLDQEMEQFGIAEVLVIFKGRRTPSEVSPVADLSQYFVSSPASPITQLASAASRRVPKRKLGSELVRTSVIYYPNLGVAYGVVDRDGLDAIRHRPDKVAAVVGAPHLSLIRPRRGVSARLTRTLTWGLQDLKVEQLWKQGLSGEGILIGHLDTGVDGRHPALNGAIEAFAELDDFGQLRSPAPSPYDTDDHGTHTAATIVGRPVRKRHVGVAPGAKLASAIVIEGGLEVARVLGGMDWIVGRGVRILNMSLGFSGYVGDFLPLVRILRRRRVLPVFAIGNEGPGTSRSPGNYSLVLSVGAVDFKGKVTDFSSSQRFNRNRSPLVPLLVAPGENVISARPGGGYQSMSGTSMAAPHIAGLAALLLEARPKASAAMLQRAILDSCRLRRGMTRDRANRGCPDAGRALRLLMRA
jgi:subtilisin family serine protease